MELPLLSDPPSFLWELFNSSTPEANDLRKNIRAYNQLFAFTSCGVNLQELPGGVNSFRIQGTAHHRIGSLLPPQGETPKFLQMYVYDGDARAIRVNLLDGLSRRMVEKLTDMMHAVNPFARLFKMASERENVQELAMILQEPVNLDRRRYNLPVSNELALILPNGENVEASSRDIVIFGRGDRLQRINEMSPMCDPLHFPLLFPSGDYGFQI
ncbi:MAG: hypothetical protein ACK5QX_00965, partial [bacterium]